MTGFELAFLAVVTPQFPAKKENLRRLFTLLRKQGPNLRWHLCFDQSFYDDSDQHRLAPKVLSFPSNMYSPM